MKVRFFSLGAVVLGTMAAVSAMGQESAGNGRLTVHARTFREKGEGVRPEEAASFCLGETVVCVFSAKGYGESDGKGMKLKGAWSVVGPDGKQLPMGDTAIGAENSDEVGPAGVLLRPVRGWSPQPGDSSGCYWAHVCVTDNVSKVSARAKTLVHVFLTAGARDRVTDLAVDAPLTFDPIFTSPGLWEMDVDELAAGAWRHGFAWVSEAHREMRSVAPGLSFLGQPVSEAKVAFTEGRPSEVKVSFYNRGDCGLISDEEFNKKAKHLMDKVTDLAGRSPRNLSSSASRSTVMKQVIFVWQYGQSVVRLDYAVSNVKQAGSSRRTYQPEYINMVLLPASEARSQKVMAGTQIATQSRFARSRNVKRLPNGDVYIDNIPMVDQGEKGYCAAATAERILSYYGTDTDQHELAQRMKMETGGGTSLDDLVRGLRTAVHGLKVQVKIMMKPDDRTVLRMIEEYNEEAEKSGVPPIDPRKEPEELYGKRRSIWSMFDKNVFLKSRAKERIAMEKFLKMVQKKIDEGIPICQSCIIGILPEEAELHQEPGGHLRLIIGYNLKTREIIYSDSWGVGHERKRLKVAETFAITTGLFTLEPL